MLIAVCVDILGPLFCEIVTSFYKIPLRQERKPSKLQNNSLISHSRPHEICYSDSKFPHEARKVNSHFCTVMSKLASITLPPPASGLCWFWCYLRCVKQHSFSCCSNTERPQEGGEVWSQPPRRCCGNVGD